MFVRARVGTNPFIEQAFASASVVPLVLEATANRKKLGITPDSIVVHARTSPVLRALSALTISGGLVGGSSGTVTCNPTLGECRLLVQAPTTLTVAATTMSGISLSATVDIDSLPCPSGDPLLDSEEFRLLVDSLWKLGGNQGNAEDRRERTALLIDSAGYLVTRYMNLDANSNPCSTVPAINSMGQFMPPSFLPGVMKIVGSFHTHPFGDGEMTPPNCIPPENANQKMGMGPSPADWGSLYGALDLNRFFESTYGTSLLGSSFRSVVVEPGMIWSMSDPGQWKSHAERRRPHYVPSSIALSTNLDGWKRTEPRDARTCVIPSSLGPTFHR